MGSIMGEESHLENDDSSLLMPPPKYKRQKVCVARDFPSGCGQTKAEGDQGVDDLNVNGALKEILILKDIESCEEKGENRGEVERKVVLEQTVQPNCLNGVKLTAASLGTCGETEYKIDELKIFSGKKHTPFEENQISEKHSVTYEIHGSSNDLMEMRPEFPTTLTDSGVVDRKVLTDAANNSLREEKSSVDQHLLPHYPIPSNLVCNDQRYPLPRRVSACRDFPGVSGRNVMSLGHNHQVVEGITDAKMNEAGMLNKNKDNLEGNKNYENKVQDAVSGNNDYTHEKPSEADEGVAVEMNMQAPLLGQSPELKGEKTFKDINDEQHMEQSGYGGKDKSDIGSLLNRSQNNIMVHVKDNNNNNNKAVGVSSNEIEFQEECTADIDIKKAIIVQCLMCAASCPWGHMKGPANLSPSHVSPDERKGKKHDYDTQYKRQRSLTKRTDNAEECMMIEPDLNEMEAYEVSRPLAPRQNDDSSKNEERNDFQLRPRPHDCDVLPPSSVASSSSERSARSKVRETLKLFQAYVRKLLQEEETKSKEKGKARIRVDLKAANSLKEKGMYVNTEKVIGAVPGVEVGDIFSYRVELAVIGVHSPLQSGIDTMRQGKDYFAISVVASGGYDNDVDSSDVLIYTGQGGNPMGSEKGPEDQKLERGNLALKSSFDRKNPVRVVRGFKEAKPANNGDGKPKMITTYTYDGLYIVERYWKDVGHHGKLVYKFELRRIVGQRQLAWKVMKQSKKCKVREGCCVDDISNGKDKPPICAINTIDDEKPPTFTYITSMMYPAWCRPIPLTGCNCKDGCSDSDRCTCTVKNGGEIPYNLNGAIVLAKPLVYECGPSCKCPPSCPNRVSQHGMKLPLEIFKTASRGWGVRCLSHVSSGSFICEYIGELLDDKQAEQRVGSDEYLFDIGQNYNDTTLSDGLSALMPNMPAITSDVVENVGFTIDAGKYGNVGRFINHSCSPNLYAQNVLYDHGDKRIPHIMLFAAENIPPLEELTYHYNYTIDQVFDSKGNIKRKNCYCGSVECTGRMY